MLAGLVISAVIMILQVLVVLGKIPAYGPLWNTTSRSEQVLSVVWFGAFVVFFGVGLLLAL